VRQSPLSPCRFGFVDALTTMYGCMAGFHRSLGRAARGGQVLEQGDVVAAVVPGLPGLAIANATVYREAESLGAALPELGRAYEETGVGRSMVWAAPADEDAHELLGRAGYVRYAEAPAMALELARLPAEDDPLDEWSDAPEPWELARVVERSYGLEDGSVTQAIDGWLSSATAYVARQQGRPVACLTLLREGADAGVFLVGTVPEARGQGLARRLLQRALHDAREHGATVSTLQSSRLGYPVYQRLGYRELCRLGMWERGR
jgi:GNAT superfamily N-acetyltransferase